MRGPVAKGKAASGVGTHADISFHVLDADESGQQSRSETPSARICVVPKNAVHPHNRWENRNRDRCPIFGDEDLVGGTLATTIKSTCIGSEAK
jgi:hypothetical protein